MAIASFSATFVNTSLCHFRRWVHCTAIKSECQGPSGLRETKLRAAVILKSKQGFLQTFVMSCWDGSTVDVCWCLLMFVDVCWCLLMFVDVCWCLMKIPTASECHWVPDAAPVKVASHGAGAPTGNNGTFHNDCWCLRMGRPTKNRKQTWQSRPRPLMVAYPVHARLHLHRVWSRCRAWPWSAGGKASSQMVHSMVTPAQRGKSCKNSAALVRQGRLSKLVIFRTCYEYAG